MTRLPILLLAWAGLQGAPPTAADPAAKVLGDLSATTDDAAVDLAADSIFRIGKEDLLRVTVFGEEALSVPQLQVRPDGMISLPLIGDIQAAGETPESLARRVTRLYEDKVRAPSVTVMVVQINSLKVFVTGKVQNPGSFSLGRETTLLQAIALVGGLTEFANTKKVLIIREDEKGPRRLEINYEKILSGESLDQNLKLQAGDTIVVP
jgi:polysaccharide export outer membrane protein